MVPSAASHTCLPPRIAAAAVGAAVGRLLALTIMPAALVQNTSQCCAGNARARISMSSPAASINTRCSSSSRCSWPCVTKLLNRARSSGRSPELAARPQERATSSGTVPGGISLPSKKFRRAICTSRTRPSAACLIPLSPHCFCTRATTWGARWKGTLCEAYPVFKPVTGAAWFSPKPVLFRFQAGVSI
ncbi:hypothetical protein CBM2623_A130005 [Cupriavidus taiwanensis]|nr:hypothetical protein CBM2608_A130005 [Cupriavidus taiwanensis]SPA25658.1 hypothetical protein CBM2623_A130005 [Cupriavidus taiwanensis]SPA44066.1 hypothetical protein CBM2629_A110005 [Cupriavidus taiwanensis]